MKVHTPAPIPKQQRKVSNNSSIAETVLRGKGKKLQTRFLFVKKFNIPFRQTIAISPAIKQSEINAGVRKNLQIRC